MRRSLASYIREYLDTNRKNQYQLKPYLLEDGKAHPVAVICPGGGYRRVCSFVEGHPFAKKLNAMGYHAVVVYYRVNVLARYPAPQEDLARAVRELFAVADDWKLDMFGYSVWGSSAGGHLAASFGTENMGYSHYGLPKPGALILTYPVVTMGTKTHAGSRNFLIGEQPTPEMETFTSVEQHISEKYPPTFLWWGDSDSCVDPENSRMLREALQKQNIPCLCLEYP
ncbi:MAG: alpha/beta hydrolase, partial [Oscillospiraceae bacterium]|nr:alpha/beta hydrolase [Oscillospiraceae bacterium]